MADREIWTVGHSTRGIDEFLALLEAHGIQLVADVRRFPGSRRHPQFGADALREALARSGYDYRHFGELGGRRGKPDENSPNGAWRVEAFNAYADYMLTGEFKQALSDLIEVAIVKRTAVMCAEAVPWRCHRRLIADALIVRAWTVWDIMSVVRADQHSLTSFARMEGGEVVYPPSATQDPP